jgi:hypothetical protein
MNHYYIFGFDSDYIVYCGRSVIFEDVDVVSEMVAPLEPSTSVFMVPGTYDQE